MTPPDPSVSVVIPSYNSKATIGRTIESLVRSPHPALREVIVVDSSDDGTGTWLEDRRDPLVRIVRFAEKTMPAIGRNVGARQASGQILAFIDSDAYADANWIDSILKAAREGCRAGGGAILVPPFQDKTPIAWAQYFLQFSDFMPSGGRRPVKFVPSCNLFCEKKLFEEIGGFPEIRASEDVLFGLRLSARAPMMFDPSIRVFHVFREDVRAYDSNQRLLGEYILRYRRLMGRRSSRGAAAWLVLAPGLAYKFIRIGSRVAASGRPRWAGRWMRSLPLLMRGIGNWTAGYASVIGRDHAAVPLPVPAPSRAIEICGVRIHDVTMEEAVSRIVEMAAERKSRYVVTPNVDHIVLLQKDERFRAAYRNAALVVADGMPLLWAASFLGTPLREKVSGSDLLPALCPEAAARGWRLFFMGGRPGAALAAKENLEKKYPGLRVVGVSCPPMGFEKDPAENRKAIEAVRAAKPDLLFLGLGTPKQEYWIAEHVKSLDVPVSIGVGATFEFVAGVVKRAPVWMQRAGLEWLWRLCSEPRRLWRRYLKQDPVYFWYVLRQKCGKR